jgi:hypothetical protein
MKFGREVSERQVLNEDVIFIFIFHSTKFAKTTFKDSKKIIDI